MLAEHGYPTAFAGVPWVTTDRTFLPTRVTGGTSRITTPLKWNLEGCRPFTED